MRNIRPSATNRLYASRHAFTLLEIVLAAGILGIVLSAMLAFFVNSLALNESSRTLTVAVSHAQYIMEDIRNAAFSTLPGHIDGGIWNWDAEKISAAGLEPLPAEQITTTRVGTELLTVTVTVLWGDRSGRSRSFVLMTHVTGG